MKLGIFKAFVFIMLVCNFEVLASLDCSKYAKKAFSTQTSLHEYKDYIDGDKLNVVLSFDGGDQYEAWKNVIEFAAENDIKATLFVSGVALIPDNKKNLYKAPYDTKETGKSNIGFGGSEEQVKALSKLFKEAAKNGHDIQSHLMGHFDGSKWESDMWCREFEQYKKTMDFVSPISHLRFPYLASSDNAYLALADFGYKSVTSIIARNVVAGKFRKVSVEYDDSKHVIVEYLIPFIKYNDKITILMDYNFFTVDQSANMKDHDKIVQMNYELYMKLAEEAIKGKYPLFISLHASMWNGPYGEGARKAMLEIIKKYNPQFNTVDKLTQLIQAKGDR